MTFPHDRMPALGELQRLGEGSDAEVFAWKDGVALKLYRGNGSPWAEIRAHEHDAMAAVREVRGPAPAVLGLVEIEGRLGLLMERVDGIDMLTEIGAKPWKILSAGGTLARLHAQLHEVRAPAGLRSLKDGLADVLRTSRELPPTLAERALAVLDRLPDGDRLCHTDFHPGNVIITAGGPVIIDWSALRGEPTADVARTLVLLKVGEMPPGAPAFARVLERVGRSLISRRYEAAYRKLRPLDPVLLARWLLPMAVHRLTECTEHGRLPLLAFIERL